MGIRVRELFSMYLLGRQQGQMGVTAPNACLGHSPRPLLRDHAVLHEGFLLVHGLTRGTSAPHGLLVQIPGDELRAGGASSSQPRAVRLHRLLHAPAEPRAALSFIPHLRERRKGHGTGHVQRLREMLCSEL